MNEITEDILHCFTNGENNRYRFVNGLSSEWPAYVGHSRNRSFVAIPVESDLEVYEETSHCVFQTSLFSVTGAKVLILECKNDDLIPAFTDMAADFIDPGTDGKKRESIKKNPLEWWNRFVELLGNTFVEKKPYFVIAELHALLTLQKDHRNPKWEGPLGHLQDIETSDFDVEVKATLSHSQSLIQVANIFQLRPKECFLFFYRMESSDAGNGESINTMVWQLREAGYPLGELEEKLAKIGFPAGSSDRTKRFRILERKIYKVDEEFPRIDASSFKNGVIPEGIRSISYSVDLEKVTPVHEYNIAD